MNAPRPLRVVHVITGLGFGGAERMLERLLGALDSQEFESAVWSLGGVGPIGARLIAQGIPVHALELDPRLPSPLKVLRLARWLRSWRPALVQTWMYHADLVGGLASGPRGLSVRRHLGLCADLWLRRCAARDDQAEHNSQTTRAVRGRVCGGDAELGDEHSAHRFGH